ncbi:MAG: hypothetical protein ABSD41_06840, partial [Candidatus Bathyarchaeia archaeon]
FLFKSVAGDSVFEGLNFQYKEEKENPTLITCGIMSYALSACLKAIWHIQSDMPSYLSSLS